MKQLKSLLLISVLLTNVSFASSASVSDNEQSPNKKRKLAYYCITDSDFTDSDLDDLFGAEFNSQHTQPSATEIATDIAEEYTNSGDIFLSQNKFREAFEEYKKAFATLAELNTPLAKNLTSTDFEKKVEKTNAKPHRLAQTTTRTQPIRIEFKNGLWVTVSK